MKRYVIRRLLMAIPCCWRFRCSVCIHQYDPPKSGGGRLRIQQTPIITEEAIAEMEEALGWNKPFWCGI